MTCTIILTENSPEVQGRDASNTSSYLIGGKCTTCKYPACLYTHTCCWWKCPTEISISMSIRIHNVIGTLTRSWVYSLCMAAFTLQCQTWGIVTETTWLTKLKIFTIWGFIENLLTNPHPVAMSKRHHYPLGPTEAMAIFQFLIHKLYCLKTTLSAVLSVQNLLLSPSYFFIWSYLSLRQFHLTREAFLWPPV